MLCACLGGALWSLAFAPFSILAAGYLSFALPCLWVAYGLPKAGNRVFLLVFAWAFCANIASLYWIAHAVYLAFGYSLLGAILGFLAILAICCYLALYPLGAVFAQRLLLRFNPRASSVIRIGLFVSLYALAESLRSSAFGGFPWNLAGYAWNSSILLAQMSALGGIELTSLLALCSYALAALAAYHLLSRRLRSACIYGLLSLAIPLASATFGTLRLAQAPPIENGAPVVRIVQPNIEQHKKWREQDAIDNFRHTIALSLRQRAHSVSLLLWPETAFPYRLTTEDTAHGQVLVHPWIPQLLAAVPRWLVFGAVRESKQQRASGYKNSLLMIDNLGRMQGLYDKVRLVPFGEFIPFADAFSNTATGTLTSFPSFERGNKSELLSPTPSLSLSVQICYEAIFSELRPFVKQGAKHEDGLSYEQPDLLFNATNDGWFGHSSGPYQHLEMARIRAIERGVPLFRAANTGISVVFDAFGREITRLAYGEEGWLDAPIPPKTQHLLLVRNFGNALFWLLWISLSTCLVLFHKRL